MTDHVWEKGQRAVINRRDIVTIDRVTKGGRVVVGERQFVPGWRAGAAREHGCVGSIIEFLTPDIEAAMSQIVRIEATANKLHGAINAVRDWGRDKFWTYALRPPSEADYAKAQALAEAINAIMGQDGGEP